MTFGPTLGNCDRQAQLSLYIYNHNLRATQAVNLFLVNIFSVCVSLLLREFMAHMNFLFSWTEVRYASHQTQALFWTYCGRLHI